MRRRVGVPGDAGIAVPVGRSLYPGAGRGRVRRYPAAAAAGMVYDGDDGVNQKVLQ